MTTQHDLRVSNPKNVLFYLRRRCVTLRDAASTLRPMNRELEAMSKETSAVWGAIWTFYCDLRQITKNTNLSAGRVLKPEVVQYESSGTRWTAVTVLPYTYWCAQCARLPCRAAVRPPVRLLVCTARTAKFWCGTAPGDSCCSCNTNRTCQQATAARPSGKGRALGTEEGRMGSGLLGVCTGGQKRSGWAKFGFWRAALWPSFDRVGRAAFWRKMWS